MNENEQEYINSIIEEINLLEEEIRYIVYNSPYEGEFGEVETLKEEIKDRQNILITKGKQNMNKNQKPYFPDENDEFPDCFLCEREDCWSRYKFQRGKRSFSYTSGRCPRLPDDRGEREPEDQELYEEWSQELFGDAICKQFL